MPMPQQPVMMRLSHPSPMVLSDRLLSLAQDAERAGYRGTAESLLDLAHSVFDDRVWMPQ